MRIEKPPRYELLLNEFHDICPSKLRSWIEEYLEKLVMVYHVTTEDRSFYGRPVSILVVFRSRGDMIRSKILLTRAYSQGVFNQ